MSKLQEVLKKIIPFPILFILILAFLLRTFWLDKFPIGITHDELEWVMNARSIFKLGKDISGVAFPLSFLFGPSSTGLSEFPAFLISIVAGLFPLSLLTARLPFALFSSLTILLIYHIVKKLIKRQDVALLSAIVVAFNPWSIFFGRTAFDAPIAVFFYLLGFLILLKTTSWRIFYSIPFFLLGFFSYQGAKMTFLPFVVLVTSFHFFKKKVTKVANVSLILFSIVFLLGYFVLLNALPQKNRLSEIVFFTPQISQEVNIERKQQIPNFFIDVFSNKLTVFSKKILSSYSSIFSFNSLFVYGEGQPTFGLFSHGPFYVIDFIFVILGVIGLYHLNKRVLILLLAIIVISPLPSSLQVTSLTYQIRASLMFPFLSILIGVGIWYFFKISKRFAFLKIIVVLIYFFLISNFFHLYFLRYPIFSEERFSFSERILSRYLSSLPKDQEIFVITKGPDNVLKQYLFYSGIYNNKENLKIANKNLQAKKMLWDNIFFVEEGCEDQVERFKNKNAIFIIDRVFECSRGESPGTAIRSRLDTGVKFKIYRGSLCQNYKLTPYPRPESISDFEIEKLNQEEFCTKWISRIKKI